MNRIAVLPVNLRNKIAAGEVVERPASVVKELIENSLDSGAGRIEIETARAGKRLIRISDNGCGMEREDAILAFERYATSKIKEEEDLYHIETMGFRGEALSSIASVAKVRLNTSPGGGMGTCLEIIGGELKDVRDCGCTGTTMEVKDLFFNTPARRKFLRSETTENSHIVDTVTREALAHWSIGFILRMDGDEVMDLPPASSHEERIMQVFGKGITDSLLAAEGSDGPLAVRAFVGQATLLRNNRNSQYLFLNGRPIKDQSISYAVSRGYEGLIPREKHPVFFLFLEADPHTVDVNVHPTKREVRFEDKQAVFETVYRIVRGALWRKDASSPEPREWESSEAERGPADEGFAMSAFQQAGDMQQRVSEGLPLYESRTMDALPFLYIGDTLVAIPDKGGLTVMDYHAAHERINYERLLKGLEAPSHRFLFPRQVQLPVREYRAVMENLELLRGMGLEVEEFGQNTVIVRAVPEFLIAAEPESLLNDLAASLINPVRDGLDPVESMRKSVAARLACHSSIRGREVPDGRRIAELMKDLDSAENPHQCPHGRPTRIAFSPADLKRMFRK
jgi:DNA mismatch repair protein MutL